MKKYIELQREKVQRQVDKANSILDNPYNPGYNLYYLWNDLWNERQQAQLAEIANNATVSATWNI